MEFLVIAHDRSDDAALARRMVVRERHLTAARRAVASGNMLIGGAILDEEGRMVGSMAVVSFPDRTAFDRWLENVPYNKNGIWEKVEVYPYHVAATASSPDDGGVRADRGLDQAAKARDEMCAWLRGVLAGSGPSTVLPGEGATTTQQPEGDARPGVGNARGEVSM